MGLFDKNVEETKLVMIDGIPNINKGLLVDVQAWEDRLFINVDGDKSNCCELPYNRITNVGHYSESEIVAQNKSTIGRAVVGGMVFGPLGAIVGGMSGASNMRNVYKTYFVINYTNKTTGEIKAISFAVMPYSKNFYEFEKTVKDKAGIKQQAHVCL